MLCNVIKLGALLNDLFPDVGLWFVKSPEPFVAPINDDVVFDCSLNLPAEIIRWRHGRKYLPQNRTLSPRGSATQLVIKVENESQLGDYQVGAKFVKKALPTRSVQIIVVRLCSVLRGTVRPRWLLCRRNSRWPR